jgi:hypothetical protein
MADADIGSVDCSLSRSFPASRDLLCAFQKIELIRSVMPVGVEPSHQSRAGGRLRGARVLSASSRTHSIRL